MRGRERTVWHLKGYEMGTQLQTSAGAYMCLWNSDIRQLEVEILIHAVQCSGDAEVVLQLKDDILPNETLEEGVEEHGDDDDQVAGEWRKADRGNLSPLASVYPLLMCSPPVRRSATRVISTRQQTSRNRVTSVVRMRCICFTVDVIAAVTIMSKRMSPAEQ